MALSNALPGDRAVQLPAVRKTLLLAGVDTLAIIGGFLLVLATLELRPGFTAASQLGPERFLIDGMIVGGLVLFFRHAGHYTERRPFWQETGEVVTAFAVALLVAAAAMFFAKLQPARLLVLGYWTVGCVMLLALRWLTKSWLIALGRWAMPAVIVGTRRNARDLAVAMLDDPIPSYRPVAFVALAADAATPDVIDVDARHPLPVLPLGDNPFELARLYPHAHVVVALDLDEFDGARGYIDRLSIAHRHVEVVMPLRGLPTRRSYRASWVNHDLTSIRLGAPLTTRWAVFTKRGFDIVGASALLLFCGPLFLALCVAIRATGQPVFFAHRRIGRHGRPFRCLKFRTMAVDAEARLAEILSSDPEAAAEWRQTRKLRDDPRVTPLGRFLRRTSLDELPQLLNVVRGEMSLVGPRPVTAEEIDWYGEHKIWYLQAWPGLTGLWQVSGRNQVDFNRRVHLDAHYVQNWSLLRDAVILVMTLRVLLSREGAY